MGLLYTLEKRLAAGRGRHRRVRVTLSRHEASFILDALEVYEAGLEAARDDSVEDGSIATLDQLLDVSSGFADDQNVIDKIRKKVDNALG
jgi:hypothetical protein